VEAIRSCQRSLNLTRLYGFTPKKIILFNFICLEVGLQLQYGGGWRGGGVVSAAAAQGAQSRASPHWAAGTEHCDMGSVGVTKKSEIDFLRAQQTSRLCSPTLL
jgi:hypothetical protein